MFHCQVHGMHWNESEKTILGLADCHFLHNTMDLLQIGTLTDIDLGQGQLDDIITNQYLIFNKFPTEKGKLFVLEIKQK